MTTTYTKIITFKMEYEDESLIQEVLALLESLKCTVINQEQGINKINGVYQINPSSTSKED